MSDAGQPGPDEPGGKRKVRTRQPTLIGLATQSPEPAPPLTDAKAPPKPKAFPKPGAKLPPPANRPLAPRPGHKPLPPPAAPPSKIARPEPEPEPDDRSDEEPSAAIDGWAAAPPPDEDEAGLEPLAGETTQVTDETSSDEEPLSEIPGESTKVTDEPESIHTDPGLEIPYEGDLPYESTQAAALEPEPGLESLPPVESLAVEPAPERTTSPDPSVEELQAGSTMIVQPGQIAQSAEVYNFDVESGQLSQSVDLPDELPGRTPIGLIVGLSIGAVLVVIAGVGIGYVVFSDDDPQPVVAETETDPEPEATEPAEATPDEPVAPPEPTDEGEGGEPTAENEPPPEPEPPEGEEATEEPATPAAGATSIEAIEAYELDLPRPSARARRMPEAARLRYAGRHRARAMRAYRDERWAAAEENFRAALSYNSWDVAAVEGMARTRAQQGEFPEAVAWGELAVERNPRSAATFRVLGDVWRQAGHPDRARAAYRRGLRRHRDDRWLRQRLRELDEQ